MLNLFRPHASKAARNEGRKLLATFLNNVAVAFFLGALLQPPLIYVQQGRSMSVLASLVSLLFLLVALIFGLAAQGVVRRLED